MNGKQLKRSLKALNRLRSDTCSIVPMEMYQGMGNMLLRTYGAIHASVQDAVDDNDLFVEALRIDLPDNANDRQIATQVSILAGQLLAYVEGVYEDYEEQNKQVEPPLSEDERTRRRFNDVMNNG